MHYMTLSAIWLLAVTTGASSGCKEEGGNWYCNQIDTITYTNFGHPGTYQKITSMSNGKCSSSPQSFSGGMSPLDGEISWHFRGPMRLKQFAFYTPGTSTKRDNTFLHRRQTHAHGHKRWQNERSDVNTNALDQRATHETWHDLSIAQHEANELLERRNVPKMITATIDGKIVSWAADTINDIAAPLTAAVPNTANPATTTPTSAVPWTNVGSGKWGRQAYYNAEQNTASGLVFLNNKGGQGSGVFDTTWGNSLSYASSDAQTGSASPQILNDALLPDNTEVSIFTSQICNDTSCGTVRPGTVAYHGFDGASKLFLLEFSMPTSGNRHTFNADMPAAWILNAQIPRTMQYGQAECSCWTTGCGEWDIFEVLDAGNMKCKSTFHGAGRSGGDSDWFMRPTGKTVRVAVLFDGPGRQGVISVLPDEVEFGDVLEDGAVKGWIGHGEKGKGRKQKIFALP